MHCSDYDLQLYLLEMLAEPELGVLRQPLSICEQCRHRLADSAEHIETLQAFLRMLQTPWID